MAEASTQRQASPWPLMPAPTHHDMQVAEQGVGVPARQEVEFKDGHRIWLSRVMTGGSPSLYLRDLGAPAEGKRIDLRQHIVDVETELPLTSTRDVAGFVALSLRLRYPTRQAFVDALGV